MRRKLIIAIDGPAGAGKSTIAQRLARQLGYVNLETGAMYRALALKALEDDISPDDGPALLALAQRSRIELQPAEDGNRVLLDGREVGGAIRDPEVTQAASQVSVHPEVREWMVARQREMGRNGGVVMEGRDIGTKVFPDADLKIFLDAHPGVRAERRVAQQGGGAIDTAHRQIAERDQRDRTRPASPLVPAPDAVHLDTSSLTIEEVVARIGSLIAFKLDKT